MVADRRLVKISQTRRDEMRRLKAEERNVATAAAAVEVCVEKDHPGSLGLNYSWGNRNHFSSSQLNRTLRGHVNLNGDKDELSSCPGWSLFIGFDWQAGGREEQKWHSYPSCGLWTFQFGALSSMPLFILTSNDLRMSPSIATQTRWCHKGEERRALSLLPQWNGVFVQRQRLSRDQSASKLIKVKHAGLSQ